MTPGCPSKPARHEVLLQGTALPFDYLVEAGPRLMTGWNG
jgi:hypothetical protein